MLTQEMINRIIKLYEDSNVTKKKRKEAKIIVDSTIEQICKHYFDKYPESFMNLRLFINKQIEKFENSDKEILMSLNKVLRNYGDAFTKSYSDYEDDFKSFFYSDVKELISLLIKYELLINSVLESRLRELES